MVPVAPVAVSRASSVAASVSSSARVRRPMPPPPVSSSPSGGFPHPSGAGLHSGYWSSQEPTIYTANQNYCPASSGLAEDFPRSPVFTSLRAHGFHVWHLWNDADFVIASAEPLGSVDGILKVGGCVFRANVMEGMQRWLWTPRSSPVRPRKST